MKRLLAILVVLTMVVGAVSAVDLTGTVFGRVNLMEGNNVEDSKVGASGGFGRVRLDGSGTAGDNFGGYIRVQGDSDFSLDSAYAWWKPIDQFKLIIGGYSDGIWGKEGVTGWGFNQMPNDSGVATNYGIWFGDGWGSSIYGGGIAPMHNRYTFFEGFNENGAAFEIKPIDMIGINLAVPFISKAGEAKEVYKAVIVQLDVNLDFGNIAITYDGGGRAARLGANDIYEPFDDTNPITLGDPEGRGSGPLPGWTPTAVYLKTGTLGYKAAGAIYAYFGGTFGDLGIDVGFSFHLKDKDYDVKQPIAFGLGAKYAIGAFGFKVRATLAMAGDDDTTYVNASILPYYAISDSLSVFLNAGLGIQKKKDVDAVVGFYVNPYLRVGAEWGPSLYVGFELAAPGAEWKPDSKLITFSVPVALMVSF